MTKVDIPQLIEEIDKQIKYEEQQRQFEVKCLTESWLTRFEKNRDEVLQHLTFLSEQGNTPLSHKIAAFLVLHEIKYKYYAND